MRSTCAPAYTCVAARTEAADGINQADRQDMVAAHSHDAGSNMLSRGISDSALLCECSAQLSWITGVHVVAGAIPTMLSENVSAHRDIHVRLSTHDRKLGNALTIKACSSPQHQFFHLMTPTICAQYGCGRIGSLYSAQGDRVASDRCGSSVEAPLPGTPHPPATQGPGFRGPHPQDNRGADCKMQRNGGCRGAGAHPLMVPLTPAT